MVTDDQLPSWNEKWRELCVPYVNDERKQNILNSGLVPSPFHKSIFLQCFSWPPGPGSEARRTLARRQFIVVDQGLGVRLGEL